MFVSLEFDADLVVVDTQVTVAVTRHRLRRDLLHLLRDDADLGAIAAVIAEPIIAETIGEMTKQDDVMLDRDVGSPSATATTAATATTTAETTAAAAEAATTASVDSAASTADARATARDVGRSTGPHVSSCAASPVGRSLRGLWPAARRPLSGGRSATSRKLPYARPLSATGP